MFHPYRENVGWGISALESYLPTVRMGVIHHNDVSSSLACENQKLTRCGDEEIDELIHW